jgi:hypothetical protein
MRKILLLSVLVLAGCRHGDTYYQKRVADPCSVAPPSQGFACIDASLVPNPDPVHQRPSKWVHFFLAGGDELEISSSVFEHVGHEGGHAWAQVKADAVPHQKYKYTIHDLTTNKRNDPEVMVDPLQ